MNYKIVIRILGRIMLVGAVLMCVPLLVSLICGEISKTYLCFLTPILALLAVGLPLSFIKANGSIYAKEGFVIAALAWIIMSLAGSLPFIMSGEIPRFINAFFEIVSGFTTTGASIMSGEQIESMYRCTMFWRMFSHWIGGMGIIVFVLAILPGYNEGVMHVYRAESPGPSAQKLVSKMSKTARILYGIYFALTVIETVMLLIGGMSFYDSLLYSFSTAGTGGFSLRADGVASYSNYSQIVMACFMFLFGINFNLFYLIVIGQISKALRSEELRVYSIIVLLSTFVIALNVCFGTTTSQYASSGNFATSLKDAFFQVTSITSTTGLASCDYATWPTLSHSILLFLTIIGACAGSTGGGLKISRFIILVKSSWTGVKRQIRPRSVISYKFEGEHVDGIMAKTIKTFFILWCGILMTSILVLSLDPFSKGDLFTNITASLACIGNVGPGFGLVGPAGNYACYSGISQIWLSLVMLAGRLEIFPILILFSPRAWKRN